MDGLGILSARKMALCIIMGGLEYKWACHLGARTTIDLVKMNKLVIF